MKRLPLALQLPAEIERFIRRKLSNVGGAQCRITHCHSAIAISHETNETTAMEECGRTEGNGKADRAAKIGYYYYVALLSGGKDYALHLVCLSVCLFRVCL